MTRPLAACLAVLIALLLGPQLVAGAPPRSPAPRSARDIAHEGRARIAALLLRYADGEDGTVDDRRVRKALDRIPRARATARRLAKQLRGAPTGKVKRALGRHAAVLERKPASGALAGVLGHFGVATTTPTIVHWLPAEKVEPPGKIDVELAGLHCTASPGGPDEVVVATRIFRGSAAGISVAASLDSAGAIRIGDQGTKPLSGDVTLTNNYDRLFASGVARAGTSAQQAQDELALAFELAFQLAHDVGGPTGLATLSNTIAYTGGVLALANPDAAPSLRAVELDPAGLEGLYAAPSIKTGGISHKLALEHELGNSRYEVLFAVPSTPVPTPTIRVYTTEVRSLDKVLPHNGHMALTVRIGDKQHEQVLPLGASEVTLAHDVRRQVAGTGPVEIRFSLRWEAPSPKWSSWTDMKGTSFAWYYCGDPPPHVKEGFNIWYQDTGACKKPKGSLDLGTGKLVYYPKTNMLAYTGDTLSKVNGTYVLGGEGEDRGLVRFSLSDS